LGIDSSTGAAAWVPVSLPPNLEVGTYDPLSLRLETVLRPADRMLGLLWQVNLAPLVFGWATDNHLLRKKEMRIKSKGAAGRLEAAYPFKPPVWNLASQVFVRGNYEMTWGSMSQRYYANSPDTPEDETGAKVSGIRTDLNYWNMELGLKLTFGSSPKKSPAFP
jgi:hypothetical protein